MLFPISWYPEIAIADVYNCLCAADEEAYSKEMINLTNEDRKQLRKAILSAYPDPGELKIFVDEELSENLAAIAGQGKHTQVVFDLIRWARAKGRVDDLILKLSKDTENPEIQDFCRRILPQYLNLNVPSSDKTSSLVTSLEDWGIDTVSEELQFFLPKQYSFEADVGDLRRGLDLSASVCRISFVGNVSKTGTGVLVAPGMLLTNYHVLSLDAEADVHEIARSMRFHFGDISAQIGQRNHLQSVAAAKDAVVKYSPVSDLDYVLLRLEKTEVGALESVPFDAEVSLQKQSPLSILQHPEGDHLKASLSNNGIVKTDEQRGLVLYVNRTKGGSSGAPCFNSEWKLVALHHKELATSFGSLREGVLFSAIYPQISSFLQKS